MKNLRLSLRFLLSQKSHSLVNLVAIISTFAVMVPTTAMVVVLSLHNGLAGLVHSIYADFDSPYSVRPLSGQFFEVDDAMVGAFVEFCEVSEVLETDVLLEFEGASAVAILRGVDRNFEVISTMPHTVGRGVWQVRRGDLARGVMGSGLSYDLGLSLGGGPAVGVMAVLPPTPLMRAVGVPIISGQQLRIAGIFSVDMALDSRYLFTDIGFVRGLLGQEEGSLQRRVSSLELAPKDGTLTTPQLQQLQGFAASDGLEIIPREMMRQSLYNAVRAEKFVIYMVLIFVVLLSVMTMAGCTLMMTAEKRAAIGLLRTMGMTVGATRRVFLLLSMTIVKIGLFSGLLLGCALVWAQMSYGVLKTSVGAFVTESYPVQLLWGDLLLTLVSVGGLGFLVVWLTLRWVDFRTIKK